MNSTICPACGHENDTIMGILGNRVHTRCRACGMDYSHEITQEEREEMRAAKAEQEEADSILGYNCGKCGKEGKMTDSRDVDGDDVIMCRDCAMQHDDEDEEDDTQEEDEQNNRVGVGRIPCRYCGQKECNFDCDESQAGGFNDE